MMCKRHMFGLMAVATILVIATLVCCASANMRAWKISPALINDGSSVHQTLDEGYIIAGGTTRSFGVHNDDVYLIKTDENGSGSRNKTLGGVLTDTIYVPDDYPTIRQAINAAIDGDTIIVKSGTYYEHVNVNKRLILRGLDTGSGKPVVDAGGGESAITLSADGITLEGFKAINSHLIFDGSGIKVTSNNNSITGNTANNNSDGIGFDHSSNNIITDNTVRNNIHGIYLFCSSNNTITNNTASNNEGKGIDLGRDSNYNTITNNTASNNKMYGIYLTACWSWYTFSSHHNTITNNTVSNNKMDGIHLFHSDRNIITDNTVSNNILGIFTSSSVGNIITDNTVSNNIADGISLLSTQGNVVTDNTVSNSRYGIFLDSSGSNTIIGNNVSNSSHNIHLYRSSINKIYLNNFINGDDNVYSSSSTNFWNSTKPQTYQYNGSTFTNYMGNHWSDYTGSDADNDGIGDAPYHIDSDKDNNPLMEPFENYFALPTVAIYTDKYSYVPNETMHIGLDVINPGYAREVSLKIWLEMPVPPWTYTLIYKPSITLPADLEYSNPSFTTHVLPNISNGTYTWLGEISDPITGEVISSDTAEWTFIGYGARATVDLTEVIQQVAKLDFGECGCSE